MLYGHEVDVLQPRSAAGHALLRGRLDPRMDLGLAASRRLLGMGRMAWRADEEERARRLLTEPIWSAILTLDSTSDWVAVTDAGIDVDVRVEGDIVRTRGALEGVLAALDDQRRTIPPAVLLAEHHDAFRTFASRRGGEAGPAPLGIVLPGAIAIEAHAARVDFLRYGLCATARFGTTLSAVAGRELDPPRLLEDRASVDRARSLERLGLDVILSQDAIRLEPKRGLLAAAGIESRGSMFPERPADAIWVVNALEELAIRVLALARGSMRPSGPFR